MNNADLTAVYGVLSFMWLFAMAIGIIQIIGVWKMYKKAGIPGWHSLIPILNIYDWLRMAGYNVVWSLIGSVGTILGIIFVVVESASNNENTMAVSVVLMVILGIIAAVLQIMGCFKMAKRFGQGIGIGFLFLLFAPIMCMVAGFTHDWTYHPKM